MPAQDRLRLYQQSRPSRNRKLKNLNLAAESQHLSPKLGLVAVTGRDHVQQDTYQRIQQRPPPPRPEILPGRHNHALAAPQQGLAIEFDVIVEPHTSDPEQSARSSRTN